MPSYCDRVLFHSAAEHAPRLRQVSYASCDSLLSSDHAAVKATFDLDVPSPLALPPLLAGEARELPLVKALLMRLQKEGLVRYSRPSRSTKMLWIFEPEALLRVLS